MQQLPYFSEHSLLPGIAQLYRADDAHAAATLAEPLQSSHHDTTRGRTSGNCTLFNNKVPPIRCHPGVIVGDVALKYACTLLPHTVTFFSTASELALLSWCYPCLQQQSSVPCQCHPQSGVCGMVRSIPGGTQVNAACPAVQDDCIE